MIFSFSRDTASHSLMRSEDPSVFQLKHFLCHSFLKHHRYLRYNYIRRNFYGVTSSTSRPDKRVLDSGTSVSSPRSLFGCRLSWSGRWKAKWRSKGIRDGICFVSSKLARVEGLAQRKFSKIISEKTTWTSRRLISPWCVRSIGKHIQILLCFK